MALDVYKYGQSNYNAYQGNINDLGDAATEIYVALLEDTYTPDQNNDDNWGEINANEVSGTGYTAGGAEIENKTFVQSGGTAVLDGDNVSWPNSTITARWGVIYDNTPAGDADKKLLAYIDFGENKSTTDGTFELQWSEDGIFGISAIQAS